MLLLLEQLSAPRAHQQLCFLQVLLCFTSSQNKVGKERAMERIWRLIGFISTRFHHEVRTQAPSSQAVCPSLCSRAACSSGVPVRQSWPQVGAVSTALP